MKCCPKCNRTYPVDDLFCYDDGNALELISQDSVGSHEAPTVVLSSARPQGALTSSGPSIHKWMIPLIGLFIAVTSIAVFFLVDWGLRSKDRVANQATNSVIENNSEPTRLRDETVRKSPGVKEIETEPAAPRSSYSPTTRLKFARGAITTAYTGNINPSDSRRFVLACRSGQQLSATISAAGNCLSFSAGGTSFNSITGRGDNFVTISNGCSNLAAFKLTVTII